MLVLILIINFESKLQDLTINYSARVVFLTSYIDLDSHMHACTCTITVTYLYMHMFVLNYWS
jgi:hypothetical protein